MVARRTQQPAVAGEPALLRRAAAGDEQALATLYDRYAGPLYGFGLRRLGSEQLAEELVQRVMTRMWRSARSYDPGRASVRTWVFTMARSAVVDLHRARPRAQPQPPADLDGREQARDDVEDLLRAEVMRVALDRLSDDHREVLELGYFRGLTQAEIADHLAVPLGTVKSRTFYALKALRLACDELGVRS